MVGVSLIGGVGRYRMRQLLNGVSRWIEYDLRNDSFASSSRSTRRTSRAMRTGDLMARLTNDLSAVRMAVGPAIMYLGNTIAGGAFALGVHAAHLAAAHPHRRAPDGAAAGASACCSGRHIHARFEAVQSHFSDLTTHAQENLAGVRIVRAFRQEDAEIARFAALNEEYLEKNMRLARLYGIMQPGVLDLRRTRNGRRRRARRALVIQGTITVGELRRLRHVPRHADVAADRARLGDQSLSARRGVDDAAARHPRRAIAHHRDPPRRRALPPRRAGRAIEFRNVGFHYPVGAGTTSRAGCCATSASPRPRARRSAWSARRRAARAR